MRRNKRARPGARDRIDPLVALVLWMRTQDVRGEQSFGFVTLAAAGLLAVGLAGCSSSSGGSAAVATGGAGGATVASGGSTGTGGPAATGGSTGTAGATGSGGVMGSGGSSGGAPGSGGRLDGGATSGSGGITGTGGNVGPDAAAGGGTGERTGGAVTGGGSGTGGVTTSGGVRATGGATGTGGTTGKGGTTGAGGTTGKGGTTGTTGPTLAFPGAQGFGRFAVGARGKDVVHVTNLDDSGPGSLRDAISQPNRTVVFDVGGVIKIASRLIFKSNQTIAGQTAPGGGITIYGDGTAFSGVSHTIVRYLRFRMGVIGESGKDAVGAADGHDIIWDHCSVSWGRDGTFDLNQTSSGDLSNLTIQDSIIAQGLQTHSTGGLMVTAGTSVIRTLFIDNNSRNPKARGTLQFVNNVVYNWVASGYILGDTSGRSDGAMIGSYFIWGPETNGSTLDSPTSAYNIYAVGNYLDNNKNGALDGRLLAQGDFGTATWCTTPSVEFPAVPALTAQQAYDHVTAHAGASLWRDEVDKYVLAELASFGKSGKTISDETSLGLANVVGAVPGGTAPKDTDQDGMPDTWEDANGLDKNNAADRNADRNGDGFTNLEEYINGLAR